MTPVAIVDYGMGNLDSVFRALEECGGAPYWATDSPALADADRIVLPGVGAFADGMAELTARGIDTALRARAESGAALLGICLGMQLLAGEGDEGGATAGLGLIPGRVVRLSATAGNGGEKRERIPHIGWNEVWPMHESFLFGDIAPGKDFYFVHSYHFICDDPSHALASTPYCGGFTSAITRGRVWGVQFHPEKSQRPGFQLLRNFLRS